MTGKERYVGMMRGERVDFIPRVPILMQFAADYIGSNYGAFASDYRVLVEANLRCAGDFGMDQVSAISDPYRETQGFGAEIEYQLDAVPRCLQPPLEDMRDLASLPDPDPEVADRMRDRLEAVREFKRNAGDRYSILGWVEGPAAEAADLRGVTNFLMDTVDDEGFVGELMDRCLDVAIRFARAQIEAGADTVGIGDAIASQCSPDLYERLVLPRERRLVDAIRQAGGWAKLHICGNITHLLPGIGELEPDILDVDHMVDMAAVRRAVGDGVVITGNLDPVGAVYEGSPADIEAAVRRVFETVGLPYMVNAGCEIPSGTPNENLKALCSPLSVD